MGGPSHDRLAAARWGSMSTKDLLSILKTTFAAWNKHEAPRLGAALAFYTILSLSPLVILVVALAGLIFSRSTAQAHILSQVQGMIGSEGGKAVESMLASTQKPAAGILGTTIGLLSLLFGASGVFAELRSALNLIWEVKTEETSGVLGLLRERFFSFGMVLSIGFLLLVSLVVSTVLAAVGKFFGAFLPIPSPVLAVFNFLVSYIGVAVLFGLIFRFVPEAKVRWQNVWLGALATAMFFTIGKTLIGLYLGKASIGSTYGAAGSVIVVIVWVYYSAQIFFFGAEFTHAYTEHRMPGALGGSEGVHRTAA
jgi:membrane protein